MERMFPAADKLRQMTEDLAAHTEKVKAHTDVIRARNEDCSRLIKDIEQTVDKLRVYLDA
jgi:dihydroorotase